MIYILGSVILVIGLMMIPSGTSSKSSIDGKSVDVTNLPDIDPSNQGGSWSQDCDSAYSAGHAACPQVPWALLKAHAIRESNQVASAYRLEPSGKASYGLLQVLWWQGSDRFSKYGFPDSSLSTSGGNDASQLYDPTINAIISAHIMQDNLQNFGNLRDAINAYNTGTSEAKHVAPGNYVNDVLNNYEKLIGSTIA